MSALDSILDYVDGNYIGRRARRVGKKPRFKRTWWNVYQRTLDEDPRTNNRAVFKKNLAVIIPQLNLVVYFYLTQKSILA